MDVVLMVNSSPSNAVTKDVTTVATVPIVLREQTSVIDPVFTFEGDVSTWSNLNYCYIPAFRRYYFVNNIVSVRNRIFEVSCHVDALMSYAEQIKQHQALVRRQEQQYNLLINDGSIRTYANAHSLTYQFPGGFNTHSLVLCVAGPQSIGGGT